MSFQGVVKRRPQRTTNSALRYSADRDISPKENGFAYSSRDDSQVGPQAAQGLRMSSTHPPHAALHPRPRPRLISPATAHPRPSAVLQRL